MDSATKAIEYMMGKGWLQEGDIVLDPMCGIGSFLICAAMKGFDCIGVELEHRFIEDMEGYDKVIEDDLFSGKAHIQGSLEKFRWLAKDNASIGSIRVYQGDARTLTMMDLSADAVLCSPPYGNRLNDERQQSTGDFSEFASAEYSYSKNPSNIGNAKIKVICSPPYKHGEHSAEKIESIGEFGNRELGHGMKPHEYLDPKNIANIDSDSKYSYEMSKVYRSLYNFLAPNAYVALVTRNFIQNKKVVELDKLTMRLMERAGFFYLETKRANNPEVSFFRQINHNKVLKDLGLPLIDWEEITFYRK